MAEMNRRDFVLTAAVAACAACACSEISALPPGGSGGERERPSPPPTGKVDCGPVSEYSKDGVFDKRMRQDKVIIVREGDSLHAMSAICTHKSCTVRHQNDQFACPCHSSKFGLDGKPTGGPARAALFRYAISINDAKHVIVDRSKKFGENEWDKDEASAKIT